MPSVHLTFDDGPDPRWTPRLLDLLQEIDGRATFFPITERATANPALIGRMLANEHTVGVHCDRHVRHSEQDRTALSADTARAVAALRGMGAQPRLWRTPWGDLAPFSAAVAEEHRLRIVAWTHDTHDWRGDSAVEMLARAEGTLRDGGIVLAHDGLGPGARRSSAAETIELVRLIGGHARRHDLRLEALQ